MTTNDYTNWKPYTKVAQAFTALERNKPEPTLTWTDQRCPGSHKPAAEHELGNYGKCIYCHERPRRTKTT